MVRNGRLRCLCESAWTLLIVIDKVKRELWKWEGGSVGAGIMQETFCTSYKGHIQLAEASGKI